MTEKIRVQLTRTTVSTAEVEVEGDRVGAAMIAATLLAPDGLHWTVVRDDIQPAHGWVVSAYPGGRPPEPHHPFE